MSLPKPFSFSLTRKKDAYALVGILSILASVPLTISLTERRASLVGRAAADATPEEVRITNLHSHGFSVSWVTPGTTTTGSISWGTAPGSLAPQGDDRTVTGSNPQGDPTAIFDSESHHVTISSASAPAARKLYFKIVSGTKAYGGSVASPTEGGSAIEVTLPTEAFNSSQDPSPTNAPGAYSTQSDAFAPCPDGSDDWTPAGKPSCWRPYPIWGQVYDDTEAPLPGTLVYVWIERDGTPVSTVLSTITNEQVIEGGDEVVKAGSWIIELGNLYKEDISDYFAYRTDANGPADHLVFEAVWAANSTGSTRARSDDAANTSTNTALHSVTDTNADTMFDPSPIPIRFGSAGPGDTLTVMVDFDDISETTTAVPGTTVTVGTAETEATLHRVGDHFESTISLEGTAPGTYSVSIKAPLHLSRKVASVTLEAGANELDFVTLNKPLLGGDLDGDDDIDIEDALDFLAKYDTTAPEADINFDGMVNLPDAMTLVGNYDKVGEAK